jgi:23S rRNA (cytidine1920-2'-O)/16S rRNA (cytidine1409-2'-O)-methyltransferase
MARIRLDQALAQAGLAPSREQAKRLIMAGQVLVNDEPISKPGWLIAPDAALRVKQSPRYVGRGGLKLEGALHHFAIDPSGMVAMDIGASTGGFTDCLLQHGAARVYALDVGTNQLAYKLREDPRVISREQCNVRHLGRDALPETVNLIVADVSFISLTLVLPAALAHLKAGGQALVLIKPQFELTREDIGPGGIVREPLLHQRACQRIEDWVRAQPQLQWLGLMESPLRGTDGNIEFLAHFQRLKTPHCPAPEGEIPA